ncbi:MAG: hypothetical protein QM765_18445 [Myxococcales bacterium]
MSGPTPAASEASSSGSSRIIPCTRESAPRTLSTGTLPEATMRSEARASTARSSSGASKPSPSTGAEAGTVGSGLGRTGAVEGSGKLAMATAGAAGGGTRAATGAAGEAPGRRTPRRMTSFTRLPSLRALTTKLPARALLNSVSSAWPAARLERCSALKSSSWKEAMVASSSGGIVSA